jgi:hypothetical protein
MTDQQKRPAEETSTTDKQDWPAAGLTSRTDERD